MEYQALYRKYRPQTFDEVVGQDHVTNTLQREVLDGKIAHAYLFAGPRGTGKTTTARVLAKALNCTNQRTDGEPCTECESCTGIAAGTSLDVIELDAASHNKVEDIREIRVNVGTVAVAGGARRIYILDEAHMLSRAASNALLKTLEEPPDHVVFVLATTEPYKLLDTIRSRSQRFDFHPMPVETLVGYLETIVAKEGFSTDGGAIGMVATHASGSMRDALSLLEQVAALGGGNIEASMVSRALGLADKEAFATLAGAIRDQDAPAALGLVAKLASQGADLRRFVGEAVGFFRGVFLAQYAPNLEEIADDGPDAIAEWRRHAEELEVADVLRAVDQLSETLLHLRQGREERLVVELALLRLTRPEIAVDVDALQSRLGRIEARVRELAGQVALESAPQQPLSEAAARDDVAKDDGAKDASIGRPPAEPSDEERPDVEAEAVTESPGAAAKHVEHGALLTDLDLATFESSWPAIVAKLREEAGPRRHALLKEAAPTSVESGKVVLEVPSHLPFHLEQLREDKALHAMLAGTAQELLGGAIELEFVPGDTPGSQSASISPEPPRAPDPGDLLEEGATGTDPTELVVDILGGEVVSD